MSDKMIKMIRKVVTHVPTGRQWHSRGQVYSEKIEKEYEKSLDRLLMGETTAFAIPTGVGPKHSRLTFFNAHIFKECVFEIELYEDRDE